MASFLKSTNKNISNNFEDSEQEQKPISQKHHGVDSKNNYVTSSLHDTNFDTSACPPYYKDALDRVSRQHDHIHYKGPQDYITWSIINIFICVVLALPALFFSVQTRDMKRIGNYKKAKYYSKRALILNIIGSVTGLLAITLAVIFRFALYHLFVQNDIQSYNTPLTAG